MKRMHIMINVEDIEASTQFYAALFNTPPTLSKPGYAKWLLEDPRINLSIKQSAEHHTVEHLGLQVDNSQELAALRTQLANNGLGTHADGHTECCYAASDKSWLTDPQHIKWELFHTYGNSHHLANTPTEECCDTSTCCSK